MLSSKVRMLLGRLSIVLLLTVMSLSNAEVTEVRRISDYQATSVREAQLTDTIDGSSVNITERIYDALFKRDIADTVVGSDMSRSYLESMFGRVPGSLEGESGVIGLLFRIFNIGILSIASLLVIYTTVFGLSASSHDGGALGSGRFSGWSIARVTGSLGMLVPTASGYSAAQVLVMKVVIAGVVSANTVWEASIDFLNEKGSDAVFTSTPAKASTPNDKAADLLNGAGLVGPPGLKGTAPEIVMPKTPAQNYRDYQFEPSSGNVGKYLFSINQSIMDVVNIIKPCREIMPGSVGAKTQAQILVRPNTDNGVISVDLQLVSEGESRIVRGFDVTGVNGEISGVLSEYIRKVSKGLLVLSRSGSNVAPERVQNILATGLRQLYQAIKSKEGVAPVPLNVGNREKVIGLKRGGWVSAGYKYNKLYTFNTPGGTPDTPDQQAFDIVLANDAGIRSYEYVFPAGSKSVSNVLKSRDIWQKGADNKEIEYGKKGEFDGVLSEKYYSFKHGLDAVRDAEGTLDAYAALYLKPIHQIESSTSQTIKKHISAVYKAFAKKMSKPDALNALNKISFYDGVTINTDVIANQIKYMGSSVTSIVLDMILENAGIFEGVVTDSSGEMDPEIYKCDYSTAKDPLSKMQISGQCIIKVVGTYFKVSRVKLYNEVTQASWRVYGITTAVSSVQGIVKGLAADAQYKADNPSQEGNQDETDENLNKVEKFGALNKVTSIVTDPVLAMLEFSQLAAKTIISVYLPIGNGLAATYMVAGVVLAAYVPFLPTLMFMFAVLAWIFAVVEAMIAAPIVFIGFANPEGHDIIGKAEQGIMLLLGVFIRPLVTIIGFILAMTLSFSLVGLFNALFAKSLLVFMRSVFILMPGNYVLPTLFVSAGVVVLYVYALLVIVEQCYSIIYIIPDQILKWIGGPLDSSGATIGAAMRSASSGLTKHTSAASRGIGQSSSGATNV